MLLYENDGIEMVQWILRDTMLVFNQQLVQTLTEARTRNK